MSYRDTIRLVDDRGRILDSRPIDKVSQVILIGSDTHRNIFTIDVARGYETLPGGVVVLGLLSYSSAAYLCVIQETANGAHRVEDWPSSAWREWFWTLPSTLGLLTLAGVIGFAVCRLTEVNSVLLFFPIVFLMGGLVIGLAIPVSERRKRPME